MADFLAAVRILVDMLNRQAASGLVTRDLIIQALRVDQMLRRIETDADNGFSL